MVEPALRPREPERAPLRRGRALPPRRRERAATAVLRAAVRRRQQLDGGVPHRLHRADGQRAAQRARGEPAGRLDAAQRHPRRRAQAGLHLRRRDLPCRLVRRPHEPGSPWARRHGPRHRRRHLRGHQHPLRAAGGVEPRLPLGRRRGPGPAGHDVHAADQPDPQGQPPARRRRARDGERATR